MTDSEWDEIWSLAPGALARSLAGWNLPAHTKEELIQAAIVHGWERRAQCRAETPLQTMAWLRAIVRTQALQAYRAKKPTESLETALLVPDARAQREAHDSYVRLELWTMAQSQDRLIRRATDPGKSKVSRWRAVRALREKFQARA
ncbi:MAG: hypothetical protein ACREKE_05600 [bacterium]